MSWSHGANLHRFQCKVMKNYEGKHTFGWIVNPLRPRLSYNCPSLYWDKCTTVFWRFSIFRRRHHTQRFLPNLRESKVILVKYSLKHRYMNVGESK